MRRLYRSVHDSKIAGVCGGLGDYFQIDPAFFRIAFVLLIFASGIGLLAYLVMWIAVQKESEQAAAARPRTVYRGSGWIRFVPGIALVLLGLAFFIDINFYWINWEDMWENYWPVLLILLGLALMVAGRRHPEIQDAPDLAEEQTRHTNGGSTV